VIVRNADRPVIVRGDLLDECGGVGLLVIRQALQLSGAISRAFIVRGIVAGEGDALRKNRLWYMAPGLSKIAS
jgi:hypothetical protein